MDIWGSMILFDEKNSRINCGASDDDSNKEHFDFNIRDYFADNTFLLTLSFIPLYFSLSFPFSFSLSAKTFSILLAYIRVKKIHWKR